MPESPNGPRLMMRVLIGLISVQTVILLGAIPWALAVQGRLTGVETALQAIGPQALSSLDVRVVRLEVLENLRPRPSYIRKPGESTP